MHAVRQIFQKLHLHFYYYNFFFKVRQRIMPYSNRIKFLRNEKLTKHNQERQKNLYEQLPQKIVCEFLNEKRANKYIRKHRLIHARMMQTVQKIY